MGEGGLGDTYHVTLLDCCRIAGALLFIPKREHAIFLPSPCLLDTMPQAKKYSIKEVLNFTVEDIQGPK